MRHYTASSAGHRPSQTGGWSFATSADETAQRAVVLWDPAACGRVIPAVAVTSSPFPSAIPLPLIDAAAAVHIFKDAVDIQHVLLAGHGRTTQLAVSGADVLKPAYLFGELRIPALQSRARLLAIEDVNVLCQSGRRPCAFSGSHKPSQRLLAVLRVLDGHLAGLAQKEIAELLFGPSRVRRDWRDPSGHLRDQVRRAIRRGRVLMSGGYLAFLR